MDININQVNRAQSIYRQSPYENKTVTKNPPKNNSEVLTISTAARDFKTALEALNAVPDIREDKITDISAQIANNDYNISASAIAAKMLV